MTFEEFKTRSQAEILSVLPRRYRKAEVDVRRVNKPGRSYTGMTVCMDRSKPAPVIDLEMFYDILEDENSFPQVLRAMAEVAVMRPPSEGFSMIGNYAEARDRLIVRVMNAERNKELLEDLPHRIVGDIALTYHIMLPAPDGSAGCVAVTSGMMKDFGVGWEELERDALTSSAKMLPMRLTTLGSMVRDLQRMAGGPEDAEPEERDGPLVLTTMGMLNGAAAIFYPGVADQIADAIKGNYYVLPSSVRELIIIPVEGAADVAELAGMVRTANEACVAPEDRLSDMVYLYSAAERALSPAVCDLNMAEAAGFHAEAASFKQEAASFKRETA